MTAKLIRTRYAATCRKCGKNIPAGSQAMWKKGYGSIHLVCDPETGKEPTPSTMQAAETILDYSEVREAFLKNAESLTYSLRKLNSDRWEHFHNQWESANASGWYGASLDDVKAWISRGFHVEGLRNIGADIAPERKRRKLKYAEEGEMQIDLMLSGFDFPFLEWEKREKKPGLRVDIPLSFNANTDAELIAQYQRWVAQTLYTIETLGIDPEVNLVIQTERSYKGKRGIHSLLIRVKKENEASDFLNWSAMFSPGGFRMLGFAAMALAGDKRGWQLRSDLGRAVSQGSWGVAWNEESRKLEIQANHSARSFPADVMTDRLRNILNTVSNSSGG